MRKIIVFGVFCTLVLLGESKDIYNTSNFYKILRSEATITNLVDAVFNYESNWYNLERTGSLYAVGFDMEYIYSLDEKVQLIFRSRELRKEYRHELARLSKEFNKEARKLNYTIDNLKFVKQRFRLPKFSQWLDTVSGSNAVVFVKLMSITTSDFVDYLVTESGEDSVNPSKVLHRKIGKFKELPEEEKITWLWRAYLVRAQSEIDNRKRLENAKRTAKPLGGGKKIPLKNENGKPPIKPYRAK